MSNTAMILGAILLADIVFLAWLFLTEPGKMYYRRTKRGRRTATWALLPGGNLKEGGCLECPKCGSIYFASEKKGFGLAKGAAGLALFGPVGILLAGIGKNKVKITCMHCGYSWWR